MNRVLLLGATFATGNMGVGALAAGALTVVRHRYPHATIQLLDYGREPTVSVVQLHGKPISVPLVNLRFSWKVLLANNVAALLALSLAARWGGAGVRRWLLAHNRWLKAVADADMAVAVSGGDSFSDIYGLGRFMYVVLPQLLAVNLGVGLIMLPQTYGPFRGKAAQHIARFLVQRAAVVYSRDQAGLHVLRSLLGAHESQSQARFCFDMGFVLEPHAPRQLELRGGDSGGIASGEVASVGRGSGDVVSRDVVARALAQRSGVFSRPLVGLNVSGLLLMGGYTGRNMFDLRLDYRALIDALIGYLIEVQGATVLLIPHVFGSDAESDTHAVQSVHARLQSQYAPHLVCVCGTHDPHEIKHLVGQCDFFIGSRMHACIAALSQAIPAVGVAYSDKFAGVFASVGAGSVVADPRHLTVEQTVDVVAQAFADRVAARAQLQLSMPHIKARVLGLLDDMNDAPRDDIGNQPCAVASDKVNTKVNTEVKAAA